jgi:hypothetical protein
MVSSVLERELHQQLEHLPFGQQRQVLDFARALASSRARGVAGQKLLQFAGTIDLGELKIMSQAIVEDCEKIDTHEW